MKQTTKYVGLDVHQATTVAVVGDETGRVIARSVVPTEAMALLEFMRGMRGAVHVVLEEGTQAQWLHDLLVGRVARVIVCDRRGEPRRGSKGDWHDAEWLMGRLRTGELRAVYHGSPHLATLRELGRVSQRGRGRDPGDVAAQGAVPRARNSDRWAGRLRRRAASRVAGEARRRRR